jgi:hypothetical protein
MVKPGGEKTMKDSDFYYDRKTLYEEVWTEPVYKVARRYGVSNVAIAKTCRKMRIPMPGRGRAQNKVQAGQHPGKTPLSEYSRYPRI